MAKIVIDARIINSSTGRYVERLLHYLEKIDQKNDYIILVPSKDRDLYKPKSKNFVIKAADFKNYSFAEQFGFKKLLDELKPYLVHFCMPQQPLLYRGKTVTTFHDLTLFDTYSSDKNWFVFRSKQLIGKVAFRLAAKKTKQIITPTKYVARDIIGRLNINPNKITVTYESAEPPLKKISPYEPLFKKDFILYVGQQSDHKNLKRLIKAHQQLIEVRPDLQLVLAGRLNKAALKNKAWTEQHKYQNIIFTDFVSDEELAWLYKNCRVYVFPSLMEGFGLPGLEAMSYQAPVVSSSATCLPEVYGKAAHYFNPKDVNDMAKKIEAVLTDKKLREKLIENGKKQLEKYSWQRMAEQTLEVYQKALKA